MQSALLPISICEELDRLNRNFLWDGSTDLTHNHLVNWNQVCKMKNIGGLGLRKARLNNLALLTKASWRLHSNRKALWC